ncbi:uncharacterized protein LOC106180175 [Lingula anatina]|uniref:Uncharacterized protein LOC106180175 n=1 Tax=Lingula anatina TaxID=7574 RepID=A0A1S3KAS0_LINAN|nr:uncharacterized protein LOC106180175 [Lingula anatina]|eukprot:XP_013419539.1 uncharacterized protein LOC106180175 [Lingula anatina]
MGGVIIARIAAVAMMIHTLVSAQAPSGLKPKDISAYPVKNALRVYDCKDWPDGFYADNNDCRFFYICANGTMSKPGGAFHCPNKERVYYDKLKKSCVTAREIGGQCDKHKRQPWPPLSRDWKCPKGKSGGRAHPDCTHMTLCFSGRQSKAVCANGQVFDEISGRCAPYEKSKDVCTPWGARTTWPGYTSTTTTTAAPYTTTTTTPGTTESTVPQSTTPLFVCPNRRTAIYHHPRQCDQFLICRKGRFRARPCPNKNYWFSKRKMTCVLKGKLKDECELESGLRWEVIPSTTTTPPTTLGPTTPPIYDCQGEDGNFPHPTGCSSTYYQCIYGGTRVNELTCPGDLVFNPDTEWGGQCDLKEWTPVCNGSAPTTTTTESTTPGPTTPPPYDCKGQDGYFPHASGCSQTYYQCIFGGTRVVTLQCSGELYFNPKTVQLCTYKNRVAGCD